ncbi:MAG: lipid-A-disaccharide synthase N-terminal domain-containing protein, partial [Phycisphaerales bacterium]|nr:lipid-A-disaccharide synthase N-terminal domain-containing protein [Phycisphaerales bacterium]
MKPGPIIAMIALIFVGMWLVLQPTLERGERIDPDAGRMDVTLGARTIAVEVRALGDSYEYHTKGWPEVDRLEWIPAADFQDRVTEELDAWARRPALERTLLGFFNISSWLNFGWIAVGLLGQCAFFGRMMVQWIVSEKQRESIVPSAFWWMSLAGGVCLFSYFVWRVDFIGVLGQSTGIVIYARNLR